jgi:hypothetical protein
MYGFIRLVLAWVWYKHIVLAPDKFIPVIVGQFVFMAEEDRLLGTGFLAKTAKYTSDQVYLIDVRVSFALIVLRRFHIYGVGWAGGGA